ncbi:Uma2 family endonuclease [Phormidium sp. FACHB-1136]|uniref:Uma2 family endonuclease n=1 Tax=Phormidium sp. FACHB-1136 TaxID=2692848 RepID=UPI0016850725|nr:Uma2 family endonuclease [Phormidium sp. FACHB-1136]MBD2426713.1 Uma2 family endonuclease [Phormidium sp. FACHB-1136]
MSHPVAQPLRQPLLLHFPADIAALSDEHFFAFCQANRDLQIERTANHDLLIMAPTGSETNERNFDLIGQLWAWARQDGTGVGFGSSGGFRLPNGAVRSPDAAWIRKDRWEALTLAQRKGFAPLCPDFVIELRSETDGLSLLQDKMVEYMDNGAQLGWLIDRQQRRVYIYRPRGVSETMADPTILSGDPVLPGFTLDLSRIW